jgi:hypothetical protein
MPGPPPKRSEERIRKNDPAGGAPTRIDATDLAAVDAPMADQEWHEVAIMLYESLKDSAQSFYYEPSDWAYAYTVCESLSRDLKPQFVGFEQLGEDITRATFERIPLKGGSLTAYTKALSLLGVTETDRRKMGVEIVRAAQSRDLTGDDIADGVVSMEDWQNQLTGNG